MKIMAENINIKNILHKDFLLSIYLDEKSNMYTKSSYLSPVVVDICITGVDLCSHVEVLCGELGLLLLHVHASTFNECIST